MTTSTPPLLAVATPSLGLAPVGRHEVCLGAFQRAASAIGAADVPVTRRVSGGPALWLAPTTLHLQLWLPHAAALVADADLPRLLNRHVRPLLRALRSLDPRASYGGRDWVTLGRRPGAWLGLAHHAASGACLVEAFFPCDEAFALPPSLDASPPRQIPAWLGLTPASLAAIAGRPVDPDALALSLADALDELAPGGSLARAPAPTRTEADDHRPAWSHVVEEAIGLVGAGLFPLEIGGDFLASSDLVVAINERLASAPPRPGHAMELLAAALDATPGAALEGVRDVRSLAEVLERLGLGGNR